MRGRVMPFAAAAADARSPRVPRAVRRCAGGGAHGTALRPRLAWELPDHGWRAGVACSCRLSAAMDWIEFTAQRPRHVRKEEEEEAHVVPGDAVGAVTIFTFACVRVATLGSSDLAVW